MTESDPDVHQIPNRLTGLEQWICWQTTERDGKETKVPIKPYHTNGAPNASTTEPSTWRALESALAFHESDRLDTDGIGFVFASDAPIVGIDLDDCREPTSGECEPWARDIVDRLDSYTEISPSGEGLHVLVEGSLPPGRNRRGNVEMYDEARFFTVTGAHVEGTPETVEHRRDALLGVHYEYVQSDPAEAGTSDSREERSDRAGDPDAASGTKGGSGGGNGHELAYGSESGLYERFGLDYPEIEDPGLEAALHGLSPDAVPTPPPTSLSDVSGPGVDLDDETVLERAMDSKSGKTIRALYEGREDLWRGRDTRYPSQSEGDMGLCFYLGFWTGGDPEQMDRLFRNSGLMRGKWDKVHFANGATYGEVCLARTLLQLDDYYSPSRGDRHAESSGSAGSTTVRSRSGGKHTSESSQPTVEALEDQAVEDAKRLAAKVQQQQRELRAQRDRIDTLEARLEWYRRVLGVQSDDEFSD